MSPKMLVWTGSGLAITMLVLLAIGTTSIPLFVGWALLLALGGLMAGWGHKLEHAETLRRLDLERRERR